MIFYGNIQIPRISGNFDACADSVYQALFPRKKGSLGSRLNGPNLQNEKVALQHAAYIIEECSSNWPIRSLHKVTSLRNQDSEL